MDFRLELNISPFSRQIKHADKLLLIGSCFTEHISHFLQQHKFRVLQNPHGILFNPVSIANALKDYADTRQFNDADIFLHKDLWYSWHHHGRFASINPELALDGINKSITSASNFITQSQWVIVTLGSAWVYELLPNAPLYQQGTIAANCHKVPASMFHHRLLTLDETYFQLQQIVSYIRQMNAGARVIFTISPVRHAREGLVENNRSKAMLHVALHQLLQQEVDCFYFPAYELVIDDLRDYRFYAEDMVHPNYQATRYVWDKFKAACIEFGDLSFIDEAYKIVAATQHRPLFPDSEAHQQFLRSTISKAEALQQQLGWIDFSPEIKLLKSGLKA